MTTFANLPAVFVNPVALALLTSSLGVGASLAQHHDVASPIQPGASGQTISANSVARADGANRVETTALNEPSEAKLSATSPQVAPQSLHPTPPLKLTTAEQTLARRFAHALMGKSRAPAVVTHAAVAATETPARTWVCGAWEDLVQGRGQARSCEWR